MNLFDYVRQAANIGHKLVKTIPFIVENKLWKGFFSHKLVMIVSLLASVIIPWSFFEYVSSKIKTIPGPLTEGTKTTAAAVQSSINFDSLFDGGNKYIVLILIQMLVVFFSNKTIELLSNITIHMSLKELIGSQIRVLIVTVRNWVFEIVIGVGISVVIGIFGPAFLENWLKWVVQCYFVGYLFLDNYNNTFNIKIKDSTLIIRRHAGAALVVGLAAKLFFMLPFIGAVLASFVCSVGATWYMHTSSDAHAGSEAFIEQ